MKYENDISINTHSSITLRLGVRSMHIMKECFVPFSVALALQKDSIYTNKFNVKMNQLIEGGFIDKWLNDEFDKVAKKADIGASTEAEPLTVDNLQVNMSIKLAKTFIYIFVISLHT